MPYELVDEPRYEVLPEPRKIGVEGLPDAVKAVAGDFSPLTQMAVGAKSAWDNAAIRMKQLFGQATPQDEMTVRANRALTEESNPAMLGSVLPAMAVPLGGVYKGVSGAVGAIPKVGGLLAPTAGAAASGAAFNGLTNPVLPGESEADNLKSGAIGGALGDLATRGAARVVRPITANPDVQALLNANVVPTMGQAAGGTLNRTEEKLTSVPFIGDVIKNARARGVEDLNRAAIQRAAPEVSAIGREGLKQAEDSVSALYDKAIPKITVKADPSFVPHLESFADNKSLFLTGPQRKEIKDFIRNNVDDHITNGVITGDAAKKLDSLLGQTAASLRGSSVPADRAAANAYQDAQAALKAAMRNGAPDAETAKLMDEANSRWAQLVRLQRATASNQAGVFSPGQLQGAVKIEDKSLRKGRYAKGEAVMQDLSQPGVNVLGNKVPDSGSAGRLFLGELGLGALGAASGTGQLGAVGSMIATPTGLAALGGLASSPLLYSRPMQKYMLGGYNGQQDIANAILNQAPAGSLAGAALMR